MLRRTVPGPTPQASRCAWLWARGAGRVAHQGAGIADVDRDGEQLEGVAEGGRGLLSPDQVDREHTRGAAGEVALGQRRVGTPGDPRVVDPPDAGGLVQACGQGGGVLADALHAQVRVSIPISTCWALGAGRVAPRSVTYLARA